MKNVKLTTNELTLYLGETKSEDLDFALLEKGFYHFADEALIATAEQLKSNPVLRENVYLTYIISRRNNIVNDFKNGNLKMKMAKDVREKIKTAKIDEKKNGVIKDFFGKDVLETAKIDEEKEKMVNSVIKDFFGKKPEEIDTKTKKLLNRFVDYLKASEMDEKKKESKKDEKKKESKKDEKKKESKKDEKKKEKPLFNFTYRTYDCYGK